MVALLSVRTTALDDAVAASAVMTARAAALQMSRSKWPRIGPPCPPGVAYPPMQVRRPDLHELTPPRFLDKCTTAKWWRRSAPAKERGREQQRRRGGGGSGKGEKEGAAADSEGQGRGPR